MKGPALAIFSQARTKQLMKAALDCAIWRTVLAPRLSAQESNVQELDPGLERGAKENEVMFIGDCQFKALTWGSVAPAGC